MASPTIVITRTNDSSISFPGVLTASVIESSIHQSHYQEFKVYTTDTGKKIGVRKVYQPNTTIVQFTYAEVFTTDADLIAFFGFDRPLCTQLYTALSLDTTVYVT